MSDRSFWGIVATFGKSVLAMLVTMLVGAVACTPASPPDPPETSVISPDSTNDRDGEFCLVPLPDSWQEAFDAGMLPREEGEYSYVRLVAPDGSLFIEYGARGSKHELRWLPAGEGDPIVLRSFGPGEEKTQVVDASFDGRYLVYSVTWSLFVWDSHERTAPWEIAAVERDEQGDPLSGPILYPGVYDGTVIWGQATGSNPDDPLETAMHFYRIQEGVEEVGHVGHALHPFRMGSTLIWGESPAPGALTDLQAISLETGEAVDLPGPLGELEGATYINASEDTVAWIDSDSRELWVWRTGWEVPVRAVTAPQDEYLQWLHVAGDIVSWDLLNVGQFALDLRSDGYTQITPKGGYQESGGEWLLVTYSPDRKSDGQPLPSDQTVVDTRELSPLPGCT